LIFWFHTEWLHIIIQIPANYEAVICLIFVIPHKV